jgi:putative oxidoreductase
MSKTAASRSVIVLFLELEAWIISVLRRISVPLLRGAIGVVFVWFGVLKIGDTSPVGDFVANTLPWFDRTWLVPTVGFFEIVIGVAMMVGRFVTLVCVLLTAHLTGTFLALIMQPDITFQHRNLFLLTTEGEFVIKNIVFIAAGLVIAARFHKPRPERVLPEDRENRVPDKAELTPPTL